jgi:hypothetical protein
MAATTTALLAEEATLLHTRAETLALCDSATLVEALMSSTDADLLAFHEHATRVARLAQAALVAAAGEVARRSESSLPDPMARRLGEKNAAALLAKRANEHPADTGVQCRLGLALTPREGLTGEILPPFFSRVSDALAEGHLSTRAAAAVVAALQKIEPHATADGLNWAEEFLVAGATEKWDLVTAKAAGLQLLARFDPDGVETREAAIRRQRGVFKKLLESGVIEYLIRTDAEGSAFIDAALDARVAPRRVRFVDIDDDSATAEDEEHESTSTVQDDRSWWQKRHDAFIDLARDSLTHDDGDIAGVDATAVLVIPLAAVTDGTAAAYFEGDDLPVSATTAKRALRCSDIITVILDGEGQPLHLGQSRRFFSRHQRRAMAARDGGCVWPGCDAPPRFCDAAHIIPWAGGGPTDIANGLLLCHFHHRRFDEDGWQVQLRDGMPCFTPPPHVDATRRPIRGGRTRIPAPAIG